MAIKLPTSIATCHCGEWLSGSKAAVLARILDTEQIRELDMAPYRVSSVPDTPAHVEPVPGEPPAQARSVRILARGSYDSVNTVFTIYEHPLWIGRKGCHVELEGAELSIRHCSISVRGNSLVVKDGSSHMGTFLDGQQIEEATLSEGVHVLRLGTALVSIEPTELVGLPVEPIALDESSLTDESELAEKIRSRAAQVPSRMVLVCVEGPLLGQEFEIPPGGLVVGREGHVRVPDEFLSRRHFELARDSEGSVRVRDLGSRNGTFLNTLPARNTAVHAGDEITAGVNRFRVDERT